MSSDRPRTVLVVDDDLDILSLIAAVLQQEGYEVQTAADGHEGLLVVEQLMPSLVLLDLKMPVMNGWEFARELRARYATQVPIVVLTASMYGEREAREIGADGWLDKPFDLDSLVAAVRRNARDN